mgnify:CR=1 FL=1
MDACCAVHGNDCRRDACGGSCPYCADRASSSDWLFGLWPGPPQRFEPTGTDTYYQTVGAGWWPQWGRDLYIGETSGAPGGSGGECNQGHPYRGPAGEICGPGSDHWGPTDDQGRAPP